MTQCFLSLPSTRRMTARLGITYFAGLLLAITTILTLGLVAMPVWAAPDNWTDGTGNWSNAGNWSAGVTTASSDAVIGTGTAGTVTYDLSTSTINSLTVQTGPPTVSDTSTVVLLGLGLLGLAWAIRRRAKYN